MGDCKGGGHTGKGRHSKGSGDERKGGILQGEGKGGVAKKCCFLRTPQPKCPRHFEHDFRANHSFARGKPQFCAWKKATIPYLHSILSPEYTLLPSFMGTAVLAPGFARVGVGSGVRLGAVAAVGA